MLLPTELSRQLGSNHINYTKQDEATIDVHVIAVFSSSELFYVR